MMRQKLISEKNYEQCWPYWIVNINYDFIHNQLINFYSFKINFNIPVLLLDFIWYNVHKTV